MSKSMKIYYQGRPAEVVQKEIELQISKNSGSKQKPSQSASNVRKIFKAARRIKSPSKSVSSDCAIPPERVIKKARRRQKKPETSRSQSNDLLIQTPDSTSQLSNMLSQKSRQSTSKSSSMLTHKPQESTSKPRNMLTQKSQKSTRKSPKSYTQSPVMKLTKPPSTFNDQEDMSMDVEEIFTQIDGKEVKDLIIDTNVILKCTKILEKVQGNLLRNWQMRVVIPYIVIEELDRLKSTPRVGSQAQTAIRWCNNHFELENSDVEGQSHPNHQEVCIKYGNIEPDDVIRDTCLYYQTLNRKVTLITDDINLRNKALLSKIDTLSSKNLSHIADYVEGPCKILSQKKEPISSIENTDIDQCFTSAKQALIKTLSAILEHYMKESLGSFWQQIVSEKPPWNILKLIACYKKHWIAVFISIFTAKMQELIHKTLEQFSYPSSIKSDSSKNEAVQNVRVLFAALAKTDAKKLIKEIEFNERIVKSNSIKPQSSQDMDYEIIHSPTLVPVIRTFDHIKKAILGILKQSHHIVNASIDCLTKNKTDLGNMSEAESLAKSSLNTLQNFLKEFGFTILGLMETPSLDGGEKLGSLIVLFWKEAQLPNEYQISLGEISTLVTTEEGTEFLRSYITELEKLIQLVEQHVVM